MPACANEATVSCRRAAPFAVLLLLALAWGVSPRSARADALDDAIARAKKAHVMRLEALASWCDGQRVVGARDRVLGRVLLLDPDHARARSVLKYKRATKTGPWEASPDYREPVDWNKGVLPEAEKRLADAGVAYRTEVTAAIAAAGAELPPSRRDALLEALVDVVPDDAEFRKSRGDVESRGRWVLPETVESRTRRVELRALAGTLRADAPESTVDEKPPSGFQAAARIEGHRVTGSVPLAEMRSIARQMGTVARFTQRLVGAVGTPLPPTLVVLLPNREAARALVRADPAEGAAAKEIDLVSALSLSTGAYLAYWSDEDRRTSGVLRATIEGYLAHRWFERPRGWLSEGVGQRLLWYATGSHGPSLVTIDGTNVGRAADGADAPRPSPEEWLRRAAGVVDRGGPARFRALLTRTLNAMDADDVLAAYGLAAYLIEARPDEFLTFCDATQKSDDPDAMAGDTFGVDATSLFWRVRRWLLEQR